MGSKQSCRWDKASIGPTLAVGIVTMSRKVESIISGVITTGWGGVWRCTGMALKGHYCIRQATHGSLQSSLPFPLHFGLGSGPDVDREWRLAWQSMTLT